jgi:prevent-host-death family protein
MTMKTARRWSVAAAKAHFSALLELAEQAPQVVERRGKPVAVVVGAGDFSKIGELGSGTLFEARWKRFLNLSARVRAEGGAELEIPRRRPRRSPFERGAK